MNKFCEKCGTPLKEGVKFCENCGAPVRQPEPQKPTCAYCGGELKTTSKFCPTCGKPVAAAAPAAQTGPYAQMNQMAAQRGIHVTTSAAQPQYPQYPQPYTQPKKRKKSAFLPVTAVILVIAILFTGLVTPGWMKRLGSTKSATLSAEQPMAEAGGVTVDLGQWVRLEEDTKLTVVTGDTQADEEEGWQMETYDISVGDLHQLDAFVEVRLPYDSSYFEPGEDPAKCLGAKYYNEVDGEWEDILCKVDTEAEELVIRTDHFSQFGAFYVKNEAKRNAYITSISYSHVEEFVANMMGDLGDLTEYCEDQETMAQMALRLGVAFLDFESDSRDLYACGLDFFTAGEGSDFLSGAIKDTNTNWLTRLGYAAIAYNLVKMGVQTASSGKPDAELTLNTLHTIASTVVTEGMNAFAQAGSATLAVSMVGVFVTGKMLTAIAKAAQTARMEKLDQLCNFYVEQYDRGGHKPMTAMDWRDFVIDQAKKYPDDNKKIFEAVEQKARELTTPFFDLNGDDLAELMDDAQLSADFPYWYESEREQMVKNYIVHLQNTILPGVLKSVQEYYNEKAEQEVLSVLSKTRAFYNTKITVTVHEPEHEGDPLYANHIIRFAPLNGEATSHAKNWTGVLNSKGSVKTTVTYLGFVQAGFPHTVQVFEPGADPDTAKPVLTVPFIIDMPTIDVVLEQSPAPTMEELLGVYTGKLDLEKIKVTKELFTYCQECKEALELWAEQDIPYTEEECDNYMTAEAKDSWDETVGMLGIQVRSDDPASGKCQVYLSDPKNPEDVDSRISAEGVYQDGVLSLTVTDGSLKCELTAEKAADGTITLSGSLPLTIRSEELSLDYIPGGMDAFYMVMAIDCTKAK